jgi:hypothetical protein
LAGHIGRHRRSSLFNGADRPVRMLALLPAASPESNPTIGKSAEFRDAGATDIT